jgi:hypothetical protein
VLMLFTTVEIPAKKCTGAFTLIGVSTHCQEAVAYRSRSRRLFSALLNILCVGLVLVACSRPKDDDIMLQHLRGIAGKDATDCGHIGLHQKPDAASDCVLASWNAHRPFFVRYDVQGIDSHLVFGLASGGGDIFNVKYDSMGWATDDLRSGAKVFDSRHIVVIPCPHPVRLFAVSGDYLDCYR